MIDKNQFLEIINATPLVSIDIIFEDKQNRILLGKRNNRPAQHYWFVPGGRIRKNETIADAFRRISLAETGNGISFSCAHLLGVYDHIYDDNVFANAGVNTHYVVLAHRVKLLHDIEILRDNQHSDIKWWSKEHLLKAADVHPNTKAYFVNA